MKFLLKAKQFLPELSIVLILGFLYLKTLAPTITFGDSGELITAAATLGIPHPPGFPTWVLASHIFSYLPFGSPAWRINVSSLFFAITAMVLFYQLLKNYFNSQKQERVFIIPAIILTLLLGTARTLWNNTVVTEVHNLFVLFLLLMLLSFRKYLTNKKVLYLFLSLLYLGLAIGTHYMALVAVPSLVVWFTFLVYRRFLPLTHLGIACLGLLLGLSVFAYLPLRARANPPINWGNPSTFQNFMDVVTRKQFSATTESVEASFFINAPIAKPQSKSEYLLRFIITPYQTFRILNRELGFITIILALVGITWSYIHFLHKNQEKYWLHLLVLLFLSYGFLYVYLTTPIGNVEQPLNYDIFIEQLSLFVITVLFAVYGIVLLLRNEKLKKIKASPFIIAGILGLLLVFQVYKNFLLNDMSHDTVAYDHGMNILATIPPNGVLFIDKNDWLFPILYLTKVEGKRPDITLYDRTGNLFDDFYELPKTPLKSRAEFESYRTAKEEKLVASDPEKHYYYAADKNFENEEHAATQSGILYKYTNQKPDDYNFAEKYHNIIALNQLPSQDYDTEYIIANYHFRYADYLLLKNQPQQAEQEIEKAYQLVPNNRLVLTQLGVYFTRFNQTDKAEEVLEKSLALDPTAVVSLKNLALIYEQQHKNTEAIGLYQKLLALEPSNTNSAFMIVQLYALDGKCAEGEKYLPSAAVNKTIIPKSLNALGVCYAQKDLLDAASHYWEQAMAIDPNYQPAKENLMRLKELKK